MTEGITDQDITLEKVRDNWETVMNGEVSDGRIVPMIDLRLHREGRDPLRVAAGHAEREIAPGRTAGGHVSHRARCVCMERAWEQRRKLRRSRSATRPGSRA